MDSSLDVAAAIRHWQNGDEAAARQLIDYLYPLVSRIVRARLPKHESEQDLMQEIFMKIFVHLNQYRAEAPFSHWASRLAITTCVDRLRRQQVRPEFSRQELSAEEAELFDLTDNPYTSENPATILQARDLVDQLLATLSAEDRNLLIMADLEGRSIEEMADLTGWGNSKIKMRLQRCRQHLRQLISKLEKQS